MEDFEYTNEVDFYYRNAKLNPLFVAHVLSDPISFLNKRNPHYNWLLTIDLCVAGHLKYHHLLTVDGKPMSVYDYLWLYRECDYDPPELTEEELLACIPVSEVCQPLAWTAAHEHNWDRDRIVLEFGVINAAKAGYLRIKDLPLLKASGFDLEPFLKVMRGETEDLEPDPFGPWDTETEHWERFQK